MSFYIAGTGSALPKKSVTNDDLSHIVDTSDEWIRTRTGIRERRVLTDETLTELTTKAGKSALADAGVKPEEIDLVLCATMRGDTITPSQACLTAAELGIQAVSFDVNAACSAMLYCFGIADAFMQSGKAETVLLLTCEAMSKQLDWSDRSTCVLFGDGAAAVVLRKGKGLLSHTMTCVPNGKMIRTPSHDGDSIFSTSEKQKVALHMDGQETYKFAVTTMVGQMEKALLDAGLTADQIDYVLPHQANLRIIDAAKKRFKIPDEKVLTNIASFGNMSSTSIPVLLDENAKQGKFKKGDKLLLVAFGAGMTAAATVIEWQK
ncbi:MAG: ketoacyl-ACP synthase III [Clostridiales bacterium]|nr:ketoacyl-ACP synthase III [Clostridiales bacterium]